MLKCYTILYTCTITRAIILDLVKDGYTKTFINNLRTFIASRGCPKNVISDNGKVFSADETTKVYLTYMSRTDQLTQFVLSNDISTLWR